MSSSTSGPLSRTLGHDLGSGLVVFLVALPLCLGVALASGAPLASGILAGIIGGILVGSLSGSQTSVSGPAAGLTAVVAAQIALLGSFQAFLTAVLIAGAIQIVLGLVRAGSIAAFFPSAVIKGLLAAIGVILILKQIPHVLGHDPDPVGDLSFGQPNQKNTFSELLATLVDVQKGAALVGLLSVALLLIWDRVKILKRSLLPAPLVVVLLGLILAAVLPRISGELAIEASHLVQVPVAKSLSGLGSFLQFPDLAVLSRSAVYRAALTIAIVASLETLLNLEAVDKLDRAKRTSSPNRELIAQGIGNMAGGLLGALPVTSVIVRSSVNIEAGGKTRLATVVHGLLLLLSVALLPVYLNKIPLAALAAILLTTGLKLASPRLIQQMWKQGFTQFLPFAATVVAIVLTDLIIGILIGLMISIGFILRANLRRPLRLVMEKHVGGDVLRIELASQVSFLNRASLSRVLSTVPRGGHLLIDARHTDYIDPDIRDLIADFIRDTAPARGVEVSLVGFKEKDQIEDRIQFVDLSTRDVQASLTPAAVLEILKSGNERFRSGTRLERNFGREVDATKAGQFPIAVVLHCIDSRAPAELVFDVGLGDILSIRIAGNVARDKVLGSMEFGAAVAGAKLVLIMGHTSCGAVKAAVDSTCSGKSIAQTTGCTHLEGLVTDIQKSIDPARCQAASGWSREEKADYVDEVARRHVERTLSLVRAQSAVLRDLAATGRIEIVGCLYDVRTGQIEFLGEGPAVRAP